MMPVFQQVVLGIFPIVFINLVGAVRFSCSSNPKCTCYKEAGLLFADCENLDLIKVPSFNADVGAINLANNRITKFPANLPRKIVHLDISENSLEYIGKTDLANYSKLQNLTVSKNILLSIESGSFANSSSLVNLDLSKNEELTIKVLGNVSHDFRSSSSLRILNLEKLQCTYGVNFIIRKFDIAGLRTTQLEVLNLASNRINSLEFGVLSILPKSLKYLNLSNNVLSFGLYLAEFGSLHSIRSVDASFQQYFHQIKLKDFFIDCNDTRRSPTCKSNKLNEYSEELNIIKRNYYSSAPNITIYLPPKLKVLYFHDNLYKMTIQDFTFKTVSPTRLTHLYLQNSIIYELNGPILGINSVKYLDLSNNFCRYISNHFFDGIQNVSYLDLSKNALGEVLGSDHHGQIFRNLANLTVLKLARNRITQLPSAIFRNLYKLEILNLSYNSLSEFSASLENMKRLKLLDLSNNQLSSLNAKTRNTIDYLSKTQKLFVNLGHNKWMCNCENLEFLQWMQFSKNVVFFDLDNFICTYEKTRFRFSDIDKLLQDLEKQCSSYIITIVIMTSLIIVFITTTFWRILYRYRWKLRYMYYVAREKYRDNVQRPDNTGNSAYYFDAFVSYADKDRRFVIELVKRLETDHNLKLCIHHRDFIPGTGVADNITNAIHNSRRTVAIMTSHFLESYWCMFELNMARMEEIYSRNGENVSFLVVLEKLAIAKIPFSFMDLIENRSYLEYPENEDKDEVSAFRSKLAGTLRMRESDFRTSSSITTQLE
nr:toll-like receptor 4 [Crassostrea gigas]XP_034318763.1 toll-like receptor 4 [Crassostrea gigas]XP_034318764.1 toll-like receptor 4 [Crassostrea gigas]XP_034318765.1 toll-like receptor 4 [Crassostrea gigas]XP_034318766.1 toll-like receptor 4 [Crassostrea gigas]